SDRAFSALLADLHTHAARIPDKVENADSLTVLLLMQNGLPVPLDLGEELGTPGLLLAARAPKNSPIDRIEAAERVVRTGALSVAELQSIADAQDFTADQFATEHAQVLQMPFLEGQSLLRQAVKRAAEKVQPALIYEALASAQNKDLMDIAADLEQDALMRLEPDARDRDMTGLFARALMMTGNIQRAVQWAATLNPALPSDAPVWARLYASLDLIAPSAVLPAQRSMMLNELSREVVQKTPEQGFAALALSLYAALKEPLPPSVALIARSARQTRWPGRRPGRAYLRKLDEALHAPSQRGAAIAFVLDAIGAEGPGDLAPDACANLVGDLVQEHLNEDARAIANAALLDYSPPSLTGAALQAKGSTAL
ncbi:MAG: hypothetical protein KGO02_03295, partial [Alphaproteobacteria bacterium]|nr:hypothetical protein [Alphaproteobacteria bacterium]